MKLTSAALTLAALFAQPALAQAVDCPLRDAPFSADSPLLDVFLSDKAKAAIDTVKPGMFDQLPPMMRGTKAPVFSAILTVRIASHFGPVEPGLIEKIDAALRAVPVTAEDKVRRCERYDNDRLAFSLPKGKLHVMLFEKMTGFRDDPSVAAAHAMMVDMAARSGWALVSTDKGGAITPKTLRQFDVIIWNNISGDVLTLSQRAAFKGWVEKGGGFAGFHGTAGDPVYFWDWYADKLIGARFIGHPMAPQFQDAKVQIEANPGGIGKDLAPGWTMKDEWYSFAKSPRLTGAHVVATLDETSYMPVGRFNQDLKMGDHPIAWTRCVGAGRSFYSAIGHRPETYSDPHNVSLVQQGILWAAGKAKSGCAAGK